MGQSTSLEDGDPVYHCGVDQSAMRPTPADGVVINDAGQVAVTLAVEISLPAATRRSPRFPGLTGHPVRLIAPMRAPHQACRSHPRRRGLPTIDASLNLFAFEPRQFTSEDRPQVSEGWA